MMNSSDVNDNGGLGIQMKAITGFQVDANPCNEEAVTCGQFRLR